MAGGNGWRLGTDPILRWLRAGAVVAFLVVFVVVALDRERDADLGVLAVAVGATLILLGYQRVVRLPMIGQPDDKDEP